MSVAVHSHSNPQNQATTNSDAVWIANRCWRELDRSTTENPDRFSPIVLEFLQQPFRSQSPRAWVPSPSGQHLMKLLAPLLQENLATGHRTIDRCEPLACGMDLALQWLLHRSPERREQMACWALHALLPLYLYNASESGPSRPVLVESISLLREYLLVQVLDEVLEGELFQWLDSHPTGWNGSGSMLQPLGIALSSLAQHSFAPKTSAKQSPSASGTMDHHALSDQRRTALWQLVDPLLNDKHSITIPKELNIEKLSWQRIKTHFHDWLKLFSGKIVEQESKLDLSLLESQAEGILAKAEQQLAQAFAETTFQSATPLTHSEDTFESQESNHDSSHDRTSAAAPAPSKKQNSESSISPLFIPIEDECLIEIRSSDDPKLIRSLDQQLSDCRARQGSIALVIARTIHPTTQPQPEGQLALWQQAFVEHLRENAESEHLRGFLTTQGEVAMMLEDLDKPVVAAIVREGLTQAAQVQREASGLGVESVLPLIAGVSYVSSPAAPFKFSNSWLPDGAA